MSTKEIVHDSSEKIKTWEQFDSRIQELMNRGEQSSEAYHEVAQAMGISELQEEFISQDELAKGIYTLCGLFYDHFIHCPECRSFLFWFIYHYCGINEEWTGESILCVFLSMTMRTRLHKQERKSTLFQLLSTDLPAAELPRRTNSMLFLDKLDSNLEFGPQNFEEIKQWQDAGIFGRNFGFSPRIHLKYLIQCLNRRIETDSIEQLLVLCDNWTRELSPPVTGLPSVAQLADKVETPANFADLLVFESYIHTKESFPSEELEALFKEKFTGELSLEDIRIIFTRRLNGDCPPPGKALYFEYLSRIVQNSNYSAEQLRSFLYINQDLANAALSKYWDAALVRLMNRAASVTEVRSCVNLYQSLHGCVSLNFRPLLIKAVLREECGFCSETTVETLSLLDNSILAGESIDDPVLLRTLETILNRDFDQRSINNLIAIKTTYSCLSTAKFGPVWKRGLLMRLRRCTSIEDFAQTMKLFSAEQLDDAGIQTELLDSWNSLLQSLPKEALQPERSIAHFSHPFVLYQVGTPSYENYSLWKGLYLRYGSTRLNQIRSVGYTTPKVVYQSRVNLKQLLTDLSSCRDSLHLTAASYSELITQINTVSAELKKQYYNSYTTFTTYQDAAMILEDCFPEYPPETVFESGEDSPRQFYTAFCQHLERLTGVPTEQELYRLAEAFPPVRRPYGKIAEYDKATVSAYHQVLTNFFLNTSNEERNQACIRLHRHHCDTSTANKDILSSFESYILSQLDIGSKYAANLNGVRELKGGWKKYAISADAKEWNAAFGSRHAWDTLDANEWNILRSVFRIEKEEQDIFPTYINLAQELERVKQGVNYSAEEEALKLTLPPSGPAGFKPLRQSTVTLMRLREYSEDPNRKLHLNQASQETSLAIHLLHLVASENSNEDAKELSENLLRCFMSDDMSNAEREQVFTYLEDALTGMLSTSASVNRLRCLWSGLFSAGEKPQPDAGLGNSNGNEPKKVTPPPYLRRKGNDGADTGDNDIPDSSTGIFKNFFKKKS